MTRLILLSSEFPPGPGGIGNHAFHLAHQLQKQGWDVRVIAPQDYVSDEEAARFNRPQPFPVIRVASGRGWLREGISRLRVVQRQIREHDPSLLLASGKSAVILAALVSYIFRLRLVVIGHGTEFGIKGFWDRIIVRWAYQQANAIICVSHFTWTLMEKLGVKPKTGKVIQNGADGEHFRILSEDVKQTCLRKLGLDNGPILLTVGNVTDRKGQQIVIRALPEILKEFPDTHYLMAGLPTEQRKLVALARELGIAGHIHFLGRVSDDDLVSYLNCCDLFLMTSRFTDDGDCEGFGIAAVEAALCGKPAIVSTNSGLIEAIIDGKTGIAVPEGEVHATAQAVLKLLRDSELRQVLSENAYSYSRSEQTWRRKGIEYSHFLQDFMAATLFRGSIS